MFRLEVYCDDKQLPELVRLMAGRCHDLRVVPVVNAAPVKKTANGYVLRDQGKSARDLFLDQLKMLGGPINAKRAREACEGAGLSPTSYSYHLKESIKAGVLKQIGKHPNTTYEWADRS